MMDEVHHVLQVAFNVVSLGHLLASFKNRLDCFRASTIAGAMNTITAPAMMRPKFAAFYIQQSVGRIPTECGFQNVGRSRNTGGCPLPFEEINHRFTSGRNLLAEVIISLIPIKPDGVVIRAGHPAPYVPLGLPESEAGLNGFLEQLSFPARWKRLLPPDRNVLFQG